MNLSIAVLLVVVAGTAAFAPNSKCSPALSVVRMNDEVTPTEEAPVVVEPPKPKLPEMSESLPFMMRPPALDGSMVGDVGFDPFGFAKTKDDLMNYREAEIKHCRLAMLVRS
jgi:Chlorophyll A-B binding protein